MAHIEQLRFFSNGDWHRSGTTRFMDIVDSSVGKTIAAAPCCTAEEVESAIASAKAAFPGWRETPVLQRLQVLHRFKALAVGHLEELAMLCCRENGKTIGESRGDVQKMIEAVDNACATPALMMGQSLLNVSKGYDSVMYREPLGVFAGIAPYNFPAMIPIGWMIPVCIATGNTVVLKAASMTPMTAMRCVDLFREAGLPPGVVNLVTCSRVEAEIFLTHPDVRGITFVGSTAVGRHIYSVGSAHGKRVQACCEAKNHALVLADAVLDRTATAIANASFGCAGQRCMALPAIAVDERVADRLVDLVAEKARAIRIGRAYDPDTVLGPVVTEDHKRFVEEWIDKGVREGATLVLDGRGAVVPGAERGSYVGPTIFDNVTPDMAVGNEEIFGPVVCLKPVKGFRDGLELINDTRFANGAAIFTPRGRPAR
ncbi:MAG: aldehyde dehydrogenase family protein, partial [Planctomycetaceae bacterium]|nr:aldehyde dehydrogenase family protein [Planctomycetaceae bacterium]